MKIAVIAHDGKKAEMVAFLRSHLDILTSKKIELVATGTTGKHAMNAGLKVERMLSGPDGGDAQIAALVANAPQSEARQSIVKALFVAHVVGLIVCLMGVLNGTFNAVGWSAVILYLFLAAGFGYFWFIKPEKA